MKLPKFSLKKTLTGVLLLFATVPLAACCDLGYYLQCAQGHLDLMSNTRPIVQVVADPQTPTEVREKLAKVQLMRDFAVTELGLPDNDSYRRYADIGRPYVVWNLVAAAEFSLEPKQWCFPVAGCVSYKGYFQQKDAEKLATELRSDNYDVDLYGVQAYSTLSWFDDPVLNTFVTSSDARLAGLLFHELAHQVVYLAGDSSFNEAFAQTVQIEGVRRWFQQNAEAEEWQRFVEHQEQVALFQDYLFRTRERLNALYRQNLPAPQMRDEKQELISRALDEYQQLRISGQLNQGFDRWMERGLNNARLAGIATYRELVPGFQAMLERCQGDLVRFYADVRLLSKLPQADRLTQLQVGSQPALTLQNDF